MIQKFKDHESVRVLSPVEVKNFKGESVPSLPAGSSGSVVAVLGSIEAPEAYLIEFYVKESDDFVLGTVAADQVTPA